MVGVEYILLHAQEPILYIIRKQQRQSPTQGGQRLNQFNFLFLLLYEIVSKHTFIDSPAFLYGLNKDDQVVVHKNLVVVFLKPFLSELEHFGSEIMF